VVAHAKERDGLVDEDDSFQVYLATSGSAYVQYAINATGYILDAAGHNGNPRLSRPHVDWNSPVRGMAHQGQGEWIARLDLPLDAVMEVMGEVGMPREWRVLLVRSRPSRDGEPQETSVLPVTQSVTPFCPARYRRLKVVDADPSQLHAPSIAERSGDLAFFPTRVLTPELRKELDLVEMVEHNSRSRTQKVLEAEKREWEQVKTLADWERFRDPRIKALAASLGKFPDRGPLGAVGYGEPLSPCRAAAADARDHYRSQSPRSQDAVRVTRHGNHLGAVRVCSAGDGPDRLRGALAELPLGL
jgi:hypothetical protein